MAQLLLIGGLTQPLVQRSADCLRQEVTSVQLVSCRCLVQFNLIYVFGAAGSDWPPLCFHGNDRTHTLFVLLPVLVAH